MIFFLISCFSFILLSKFSLLSSLPTWKGEMGILKELSPFLISWFKRGRMVFSCLWVSISMPSSMRKGCSSRLENVDELRVEASLLDLPDLVLECILEKLSPAGLIGMAGVCTSLRDMCRSDHFWERQMKQKWGRLIGDAAYREWQSHISTKQKETLLRCSKQKGLIGYFSSFLPLSWSRMKSDGSSSEQGSCLPVDSIMAWYLALESGKFWFPAQVYNREYGNVGFLLSCYDAEVRYDSRTNTFRARYSALGRETVEDEIEWNRLRAPAVDTHAHVLHVSDCLNGIRSGDHIEIQWRRNKEFPYGWWYGVVGHLESCDGNKLHCLCHKSDDIVLEFKQYAPGSPWRQVVINRKDHRKVGDEADGFYGGIRKVCHEEEILMWKRLWPTKTVEQ